MGKASLRGRIQGQLITVAVAAIIGLLLSMPTPARADLISTILSQSDIELPLQQGVARGRVTGREGDALVMQLRGVKFRVPLAQITTSPEQFLAEARDLSSSGKFRRAAVQYGIARLLDQQRGSDPALQRQIVAGLGQEKQNLKQFRNERIKTEQRSFESNSFDALARNYPALNRCLDAKVQLIPWGAPAAPALLEEWQTAVVRNPDAWMKFRQIRDDTKDTPDLRLNALLQLVRSLPPLDTIREDMKTDTKRLDSIIALFVYADANLWIDHLQYVQVKNEFTSSKASYTPPIQKYRAQARDMITEKLVPSTKTERVKVGNMFQDKVVPIERDEALLQQLQPRINAPFVEERRSSTGYHFLTTEGDEVDVPLNPEFEAQKTLAANAEQEFQNRERTGLINLKNGIRALALAWGSNPNDTDLTQALRTLQQEVVAFYTSEPGHEAPTSQETSASAPAALPAGQFSSPFASPFTGTEAP